MTTVIVAARDALVRDLVSVTLGSRGIVISSEVQDSAQLAAACATNAPDVVVTDSILADGPLVDLQPVLTHGGRVLVLSSEASPERLVQLLAGGAAGYLLVDDTDEAALADAVETVASGRAALHPSIAQAVLEQWRALRTQAPGGRSTLSPRELDVLCAMAEGLGTKAIARRLGLAVKTVEHHKGRVFAKLSVRNQAHAVAVATEQGLLPS